jgi:hypothetical protein
MSSGYGSLPRTRYNRGKRVAIVAACASVLSGTTLALPAASFAAQAVDTTPVLNTNRADATVNVPDVDALPGAEAAKDDSAPETGVLELWGNIDPVPDVAEPAPATTEPTTTQPNVAGPATTEPTTTAPTTTAPTTTAPTTTAPTTTAPTTTAPVAAEPVAKEPLAAAPTVTGPTVTGPTAEPTVTEVLAETLVETLIEPTITIKPAPSVPIYGAPSILRPFAAPVALKPASDVAGSDVARPTSNRVTPPSAAAEGPRGTDLDRASLVAGPALEGSVVDAQAQRQLERSALREADVLGIEKASPNESKGGLGLSAPLTDVGPRGVDTVDLAARNAPTSSMGDWNLLPEALYAVVPLLLAGAAVAAHSRRNSRVAPLTLAGVHRGRHANLK